ncbi:MAG: metallophosphatase family protein [Chitinispirillales bacterium]|jgi:predicted phosphodiesterase|nr:metallophosphatase family protein [Chitinispirillales bacterium]
MRLAFISDIHANLEALEAVLEDMERQKTDEVYCLGDVVGYGANPNECTEIISKLCANVLLGNHDAVATGILTTKHFNVHARVAIEWTAEQLTPENKNFLSARSLSRATDLFTMVHATPYEPGMWYYITSLEEAAFNFQFFGTKVCFVGHTHIPMIIAMDDEEVFVHQGKQVFFKGRDNLRLLINIGSVGQPRDRNPESSYGILDTVEETFTLRRVPYNITGAQNKMKKIKMPEFLINRLTEGR